MADEIIRTEPSLSYLSHLLSTAMSLPSPIPSDLESSSNLTVFAPANEAFDGVFDATERAYLEGQYGSEGVGRILGGGIISGIDGGRVGWSDNWGRKQTQGWSQTMRLY
jgi:uncharacterized surface protein with fasciclin (FAS1) repeats